jgi:hypothetical protein
MDLGERMLIRNSLYPTDTVLKQLLDYFLFSGAGWQSRMDAFLREYVESRSGFDAEGP